MGDPVLAMHRHADRRYELTSLRTGSLRDQMLRATTLVERLLNQKLIGPQHPGHLPLLVVGAGAAGVCAALRASRLGVDTCLVESRRQPLMVQKGVNTRRIDPVEFDWPHPHWQAAQFPAQPQLPLGRHLPLAFPTELASVLALRWRRTFQLWRRHHAGRGAAGQLVFWANTPLLPADIVSKPQAETWTHHLPQGWLPTDFGAVLACTGFGPEDVWAAPAFHGAPFWSADTLTRLPGTAKVLVSGGGDGAMQDFLRAATNSFGRPLFHAMGVDQLTLNLEGVRHAEDVCRRLHAWSDPTLPPDAAMLAWWQQQYETLVEGIWRHWLKPAHTAQLRQAMAVLSGRQVLWVMKFASPGHSYGLNRLLALLVVRLLERQHGAPALFTGVTLSDVQPLAGAAQQVTLSDGLVHDVDTLVVRHGLPATLPENGSRPARHFFGEAPISDQLVPPALL
jgi:hypothetical protein